MSLTATPSSSVRARCDIGWSGGVQRVIFGVLSAIVDGTIKLISSSSMHELSRFLHAHCSLQASSLGDGSDSHSMVLGMRGTAHL
jgi:hypothetical protein